MADRRLTPIAQVLRLAPFIACTALAFVLVAAAGSVDVRTYVVALVLTVAVVAAAAWFPWERLPRAAHLVPATIFLLAAGLLRDAGGGANSGVSALALLPVFWIALHGSGRQLAVIIVCVAIYFVVPTVFIGGTAYPASGYRAAVLFAVVGGAIGATVQHLVAQVRGHAAELERGMDDIHRVAAASRRLATSDDARGAVCAAACDLGEATFALLVEPDGRGGLVSTAMAGLEAPPFAIPAGGAPTCTMTAFTTRRRVFAPEAGSDARLDQRLWAEHGYPASMLFQPVLCDGVALGVLTIGWSDRVRDRRRPEIISLLADEAAIAIQRADLVEELSGLATTDALTGALNRRAWDGHIERALADGAVRPVTVALLDLDKFKVFNDTYGHQRGDRLLKEAAAAWRTMLRPGDLLARYGGEEFAVLLRDCDERRATPVLERLRAATPAGETCSVGIAQWDGDECAEALVARADRALYAAKAAGRDRTMVASAHDAVLDVRGRRRGDHLERLEGERAHTLEEPRAAAEEAGRDVQV